MASAFPVSAAPPSTDRQATSYTLQGVTIEDPYLWLEGSDAPEFEGEDAELDERVSVWTDAQNGYTRAVLEGLDGRAALEAELTELL